ncbi:uncharacterized protein [Dysidea avara]|uniref:uncharacterized protein n=1 Tax=Dysidea avara TaxID=196820 RepID=UPI00331F675B
MHVIDGCEQPVACASRTLSQAERNYAQVEREALSIIFGVKRFNQYLYGRHFTLVTDHRPLCKLFGHAEGVRPLAAARMQRWALILSAYSYKIQYTPGTANQCTDCLSRLPSQQAQLLDELHLGHIGICRVKALARSYIWWPGLDTAIETLVSDCEACKVTAAMPAAVPRHPWQHPNAPWDRVHIDYGHQRQVHIDQLIPAGSVAKGPSEVLQKPVIPEVERSTTQVTQLLQDSPPVIDLTVSRFDTNNSQKYPYAP